MHPSRSGSAGSPLTASLLTRVALPRRGGHTRAELRVLPVLSGLRLGQPPVTAAPAPAWHGRCLSAALSALKRPREALLGAAPRPRQRPGCFPAFVGAFALRVCLWSPHARLLGPAALLQVPFPKGRAGPGFVRDDSVTQGRSDLAHLLFDVMES